MPQKPKTYSPRRSTGQPYSERVRGSSTERGYDYTWQRFRESLIGGDPLRWLTCAECKSVAVDPSLIHIDHVRPLAQGGRRLDKANLQPLCPACHGAKTAAEGQADTGGRGGQSLGGVRL